MQLTGDIALLYKLHSMPVKMQKKYGRRAVTKAGRLVVKAAKKKVPTRTGQLKKSLGQRGRTYGDTVITVVGARTGFETTDKDGKKHDPTKIAHLVEMGHGGPHPAPAHPFLRPAFDETQGSAQAVIAVELAKGIEAEGI